MRVKGLYLKQFIGIQIPNNHGRWYIRNFNINVNGCFTINFKDFFLCSLENQTDIQQNDISLYRTFGLFPKQDIREYLGLK